MVRLGLIALLGVFVLAALGALGLRWADDVADARVKGELRVLGAGTSAVFDPAMVEGLPEPAQRFFLYALSPGAPLGTVAEITMQGQLDLGPADAPNPQPMQATQVLAPPYGFVWTVQMEAVSGSDALAPATSWSRFRLFGVVPAGRGGGDADHKLSAFGRMVGEGLFWTPAAFLPAANAGWEEIEWTAIDTQTAEVFVRYGDLEQTAQIRIDADGKPQYVVFPRWSNENPQRQYRHQPFGGDMSAFRDFDGTRVPTHVIGGNNYGTPEYRPFFDARDVTVSYR